MSEMTKTRIQRRQFSAEERAQWVELYERSGQSLRQFSGEHGLVQSNLSRWRRQLRAATTGKRGSGSFVEVSVTASPPQPVSAAPVRVCLSGGMTMEVTSGTDALWLAQVLRALSPAQG
jgi:transposase-like protein